MLRLSTERRRLLAEKLADAANIIFGGFVVGQFIGGAPFSWAMTAVGLLAWAAMGWLALIVEKRQ